MATGHFFDDDRYTCIIVSVERERSFRYDSTVASNWAMSINDAHCSFDAMFTACLESKFQTRWETMRFRDSTDGWVLFWFLAIILGRDGEFAV